MSDGILAQHPPAVKVGGRRLSVTSKPKIHNTSETAPPVNTNTAEEPVDYPRPTPHVAGEENVHPPPHNNEEEVPKKDKKQGNSDNEKKLKELAHRKADATRPTRDAQGGGKNFGAAGRIAQPAGKGLGV